MHKKLPYRNLAIAASVSLIFCLFFLKDVVVNIDKPLEKNGELTWQYFLFDNNFKKLESLDFENLFNTRMYYPHKNTLAYGNSLLGQSVMGLPIYLLTRNTIVASNSAIIINFFLAFLFTYFLAFKFTKNLLCSIVAAVIYTYNPYVLSHIGHEQWALEWIPFLFLVIETILEKGGSLKSSLLLTFGFLFLEISTFYYTIFFLITAPFYIFLRVYLSKIPIKKLLHKSQLAALAAVVIFSLLFIQPFLAVKEQYSVKRNLVLTTLLSAKVGDFAFTSPQNFLYGKFAKSDLRDNFARVHYSEHSLFPGFAVILITTAAIVLLFKRKFTDKDSAKILALFGLLVLTIILSVGPFLEIGAAKIPLPYLVLYKLFPFIDTIRAPSRFVAVSFLALGLICAITLTQLSIYFKKSKVVLYLLLAIITLEYTQSLFPNPYQIPKEKLQFYSWLNNQPDINIIIELPYPNGLQNTPFDRSSLDGGVFMLYAAYHNKYLLNGHHSFIPAEADKLGKLLAVDFPNQEKLNLLKKLKVDLIIVHKEEYKTPRVYQVVSERFKKLGLGKTYQSKDIESYKIK